MAEETQYTANVGKGTLSVANSNIDGTGTLQTILTGASNGTLIKSINIKAIGNVTDGMIRFFIQDAIGAKLLLEVPVEAVRSTKVTPAFERQINLNMTLQAGYVLKASTQNAESFKVFAEGMNWTYYAPSVRPDTTQWTTNNGFAILSTANPNLDGTGTLGTVYTSGSSATYKGSSIRSITIKSIQAVTPGMIRLFLVDASNRKYLLSELEVGAESKAATTEAFERTIIFDDDLDIEAGDSIMASTENAEIFHVFVEGTDWNYVA